MRERVISDGRMPYRWSDDGREKLCVGCGQYFRLTGAHWYRGWSCLNGKPYWSSRCRPCRSAQVSERARERRASAEGGDDA